MYLVATRNFAAFFHGRISPSQLQVGSPRSWRPKAPIAISNSARNETPRKTVWIRIVGENAGEKPLRKNASVCWKIQKNASMTTWASNYKVWSHRSWTCLKMSILWQVHFGWYQRCCAEPWLTPWSFWPTSNRQAWFHSRAVKWGDFLEILKSGFHFLLMEEMLQQWIGNPIPLFTGFYTSPMSSASLPPSHAWLRGIRVIPEFDMPGHTSSWRKSHPELFAEGGSSPGSCINWKVFCTLEHFGVVFGVWSPSSHQPLPQCQSFFWVKVLRHHDSKIVCEQLFLDWLTSCIGFHLRVLEPYFCGIGRDHTSVSCHCGLLVKANMVRGVIFSKSDGGWRGDTTGMIRIYSRFLFSILETCTTRLDSITMTLQSLSACRMFDWVFAGCIWPC